MISAQSMPSLNIFQSILSSEKVSNIKDVSYFKDTQYANLDIAKTLEYFSRRFVLQIQDFKHVDSDTTVVDVGAGFGWLAIAFALLTKARVIAVEPDESRLKAGQEIATILGVDGNIDWRVGSLGNLPVKTNEASIVYCVEVLEHVYGSKVALSDLCRISNDLVVITTPNLLFPVVAHDTGLPFCHWLPIPVRREYAKLFNKDKLTYDNIFWSPQSLKEGMKGFVPISPWLHYASYNKFLSTFPLYLPYGTGREVNGIGLSKKLYYGVVSKLGMLSHYFVPSLSYVFQKECKNH